MFASLKALTPLCALVLLTACGGDPASPGGSGGGGSGGSGATSSGGTAGVAVLELRAVEFTQENSPHRALGPGDSLHLERALQGGHVMYVGAQVRGLGDETVVVQLGARLLHPETRAVEAEDSRSVVMQPIVGQPGWLEPDTRTVSQVDHIPACPNYDLRSIRDTEWILELTAEAIEDTGVGAAEGSIELSVIPRCEQDDEILRTQCECECAVEYEPGSCG